MPQSLAFGPTFLGALQASLSVLLTISYGVAAAQFKLLDSGAAKQVSRACVNIFLPALLLTNLGGELSADTASNYLPVLGWAILCNALSIGLGTVLQKTAPRWLNLPSWTTPAIAFNNTTSMPLLLIQALEKTGILDGVLDSDDSVSSAVKRAKTYFLINTMVSNSLTFALGPKLLDGPETEDAPDRQKDQQDDDQEDDNDEDDENGPDEHSSLLPSPIVQRGRRASRKTRAALARFHRGLPSWLQTVLHHLAPFANAPVIGAALGAIIGLTPPLKRAFFADTNEGGVLSAWLTTSLENVGDVFAALQVVVVGVKLAEALREVKEGLESDSDDDDVRGPVPWKATMLISVIRFALWPVVSILAIWALAKNTSLLASDPMLAFTMMLMPAGPPALKLSALAEVSGSNEGEKLSVAKFLAFSYAISPLMAFTVVASLRATQDVVSQ